MRRGAWEDIRLPGNPRWVTDNRDLMQIPDEIRKCIGFVAFDAPDHSKKVCGTVFYLGEDISPPIIAAYAVTARHVIEGIRRKAITDNVFIRMNAVSGDKPLWLQTKVDEWIFHPDEHVDVALHMHAPPADKFDLKLYPVDSCATPDVLIEHSIGVGDEVFLPGLFVRHYGQGRNIPIVRSGCIAAMPDEPVETAMGPMEAYLIEARSIGGLSGSPVFAHLGVIRQIDGQIMYAGSDEKGGIYFLLGLMHGHWDLDAQITAESVNMGIGIVAPVTKVLEVITGSEVQALHALALGKQDTVGLPKADIVSEKEL